MIVEWSFILSCEVLTYQELYYTQILYIGSYNLHVRQTGFTWPRICLISWMKIHFCGQVRIADSLSFRITVMIVRCIFSTSARFQITSNSLSYIIRQCLFYVNLFGLLDIYLYAIAPRYFVYGVHVCLHVSYMTMMTSIVFDILNDSKMSMSGCRWGFIYFWPYVPN